MNKRGFNVLFVVHRYAPFPGGSEANVQNMAEGLVSRGHNVTVLAGESKGDLNKVRVTGDVNCLAQPWDLIIVHGGDVNTQNIAHVNAAVIKAPVLYLIIKPSSTDVCRHGLRYHDYIGYGTSMDIDHIKKWGVLPKARRMRYGLNPDKVISDAVCPIETDRTYFVSSGGFWPHKGHKELAHEWNRSDIDADLYLIGYGALDFAGEDTDRVKWIKGPEHNEVMAWVANANGYIMNSFEEGFGLVLVEAMMNRTPWYARNIAGAHDMKEYGTIYSTEQQLIAYLKERLHNEDPNNWMNRKKGAAVQKAYKYAMQEHTVDQAVDDIEDVLLEISMKWMKQNNG